MRRLPPVLAALLVLPACSAQPAGEPPLSTAPGRPQATPSSAPAIAALKPRIPKLLEAWHFEASVVPVGLDGVGALVPPSDPAVLGWWGRPAGTRRGVTLLAGHTVQGGGGVFDDLEDIPLGEPVSVSGIGYRVTAVEVIPKEDLAARARSLFSQGGSPRLVLVTCEGYDPATGEYDDNVVVTAVPAP